MISDKHLQSINNDLIRYLTECNLIDTGSAAELTGKNQKKINSQIIDLLQQLQVSCKINDVFGLPVLVDSSTVTSKSLPAYDLTSLISAEQAKEYNICPIGISNGILNIATVDPFNIELMDRFEKKLTIPIAWQLTSVETLQHLLNITDEEHVFDDLDNDVDAETTPIDDTQHISLDEFFENLISSAVRERASDIHCEQSDSGMTIRIRVDGKLKILSTIDDVLAQAVVAKIKIASDAKLDETRLPQDKRIRIQINGKSYDLRISILPTIHGENVAIRIFDQADNDFELNTIGLLDEQMLLLKKIINCPNGLILLCGPTGCGKTTTLYTILKAIASPRKKIITIEDPIEYRLDGINQVPVNDEIGLSFASILRSVLRQSPNVIMVGEIRDKETAELAIQAALTGHLVFSTVHCRNAASALTRLLDFKISKFLIGSCLRGTIAQQLVRKSCPYCRIKRLPSSVERALLHFYKHENLEISTNCGCSFCDDRGYKGRRAIFDFLIHRKEGTHSPAGLILDDFYHVSTFYDNVMALLKTGDIIWEDARQVLSFDMPT